MLRWLRRRTRLCGRRLRSEMAAGRPARSCVVVVFAAVDDWRRRAGPGRRAAAGSISLLGWALGSVIEGLAAVIVIWRFTGSRALSDTAEGRAQKAVAVSFFLLAPYMAIEAVRDLAGGHLAGPSTLGIVVTASSLLLMPALGIAKKRLGAALGSGATAGEGGQNLLCAAQAAAVLIGLAATAAFGWSWVDPVIALLLAGWAIREGSRAWRGQDCC